MPLIPGPKSKELSRRLAAVESRNVTFRSPSFPIFWESAQGCRVRDVDGNQFLDLTSAFGVSSLGHRALSVKKAMTRQATSLWHGMGDVHPTRVKVELLERLASLAPRGLTQTILSCSGAEAIESALKTARLYTGKRRVLAFDGAYHGLTYETLAVTSRPDFKKPFHDQIAPIAVHVPYPDDYRGMSVDDSLRSVEKVLKNSSDIGAILVEPMQARGGIRIPPTVFMRTLRKLATRYGALLIADEIYTGFGRTGSRFGVNQGDVIPDLLCLGKALANGFPLSACIGSRRVMSAWPVSNGEAIHTSTFLGNPLGCAMALAALRQFERQDVAAQAKRKGDRWLKLLRGALQLHPRVGDVRGIGLMVGIEFVSDKLSKKPDAAFTSHVVVQCLKKGLIVLSGGNARNVLTLTPPLIITERELAQSVQILREVIYGKAWS